MSSQPAEADHQATAPLFGVPPPEPIPPGRAASTAVVILNHNGRELLARCLGAALQLEGLAGPEAIVVADNGSSDDSLDIVRRLEPRITRLAWESNQGFALGNNRAAELVDAEFLLFLNNDTLVAPSTLELLAEALGGDVACVGARLVDLSGQRLDFDGGGMAFTGHGHALGFGRRIPKDQALPRPTLFASGAAMLVHRPTFLRLGGFDPHYFCYYEDVDFGWRLWLAGYRALHVPAAVVRHVHGATARFLPADRRARLYERNALATVVKNYDPTNLARVLPAALALAAFRHGAPLEVIATATGAAPIEDRLLALPDPDWPGWPALADLQLDWSELNRRRETVQRQRRRPDESILPLFAQAYAPIPPSGAGWLALAMAVRTHGLEALFGPLPRGGRVRASLHAALRRLRVRR